MPLVGFQPCFGNGYCPADWNGTQIFLYEATESSPYTRHGVGLQHLAFQVGSRSNVEDICLWAKERGDEIVRSPKAFPQFGPDQFATFFLSPQGFMIEVVTHDPE